MPLMGIVALLITPLLTTHEPPKGPKTSTLKEVFETLTRNPESLKGTLKVGPDVRSYPQRLREPSLWTGV